MACLLVLIPLAVIILLNLFFRNVKKLGLLMAALVSLAQIAAVLFVSPYFWFAKKLCIFGNSSMFNFSITGLSLVMMLAAGITAFAAVMVGMYTIKDEEQQFSFSNLVILAVIGMNGIVMVTDLFSMYVFLEIVAVTSFILIALNRNVESLEGSFKYLVLSAIATILMLAGIALLFLISGGTSFIAVKQALYTGGLNKMAAFAICLFLGGLFIKGGLVPFHGWLPDAYSSAPTSVSVLLAGIVTKTTGIYTIIILLTSVFVFNKPIQDILLLIGAVSVVFGALAAITQKDFKRMLAYSSISQVGYIILSLGTGTALGFAGAVFHMFNHAIFKSQLFVNSAAVEEQAGTVDIDKMGGFGQKMPITGFTSVIACLSTAGIPPLAGFWSKLVIILALWTSGHFFYTAVAVIASLITLGYFLVLQRHVFFGKLREGFENLKEAPYGIALAALLLTGITIGIGVLFPFVVNTIILPISKIM
ncbi:MAG: proton-conducting transporter membrane subunit [Armatimonadota bacterium]